MQPCHVCGGMMIDAAGYCTQCRTYRGQVPPQGYSLYPDQQSAPPYPAQPGVPPYPGQPSGPPYPATPVTMPYQPGSYPPAPQPASYPPAPPRPGGGRSPFLIPLIALCVALVIVAVGIVVVVVVKSNSNPQAQTSSGPTAAPGQSTAIDPCLVGTWTVSKASQQFPISGVGNVQITLKSGTQTVAIGADGTVEDDYGTDSRYEGSGGGHTYTLDVAGKAHYTVRTANSTITFIAPSANGTIAASVDGVSVTSIPLSVTSDPVHYTCSGGTATEHTDTYDATLTRQAG